MPRFPSSFGWAIFKLTVVLRAAYAFLLTIQPVCVPEELNSNTLLATRERLPLFVPLRHLLVSRLVPLKLSEKIGPLLLGVVKAKSLPVAILPAASLDLTR